ncbi:DUF4249 domain-containing protein [Fulvivirgaceae bacterium BMA10]|uniref:DUF4249 domain-containing protein n=1 Tax=Splendidivirga corallicola TaxID=3051826 RepID=A0ABT8KRM6_9BACT|nr:DUF4249 domain-containing protein [Fulvivirgaceae bacterium BMA10]
MKTRIAILILSIFCFSTCVDPIEFDTSSEPARLVVEGFISDLSAAERSDPYAIESYFKVKLSISSPVSNQRDEVVSGATVKIVDDSGGEIILQEFSESGEYYIIDQHFKAQESREYKLQIITNDGKTYESLPERVHKAKSQDWPYYELDEKLIIQDIGGKKEPNLIKGINVFTNLPDNETTETAYYRWDIIPTWVYIAPLPSDNSPLKTCWVTNDYYFKDIVLHEDNLGKGNYPKQLFFLPVTGNDKLKHDFSVLIRQFSLSEKAYDFWESLKKQRESVGSIFDPPPFTIKGNIINVNDPDDRVLGYFSVASESEKRWFVNIHELPYTLEESNPCDPPPGVPNIPTPDCLSCFEYGGGSTSITNQKPPWWR